MHKQAAKIFNSIGSTPKGFVNLINGSKHSENGGASERLGDQGDQGLFVVWTCCFIVQIVVSFSLNTGQIIGDFANNRELF